MTETSNRSEYYFPGLNGIRAIAVSLVLFSHIGMYYDAFGFTGGKSLFMAGQGVTMFFVLSGFLITFLLLKEQHNTHKVDIIKFYKRRILRIWPVYYCTLFIGILYHYLHYHYTLYPQPSDIISLKSFLLYMFFLPNITFALLSHIPIVAPLWSVGVEEQFYLFWPWLLKLRKYFLQAIVLVTIIYIAVKLGFSIFWPELAWAGNIIELTRFDCMSIGALGAYILVKKPAKLLFLYHPVVQFICWAVFIASLFKPIILQYHFEDEIYALIFLVLILNVSTNQKSIIKLEFQPLIWLGRISYGIYAYHMFAIMILAFLFNKKLPQTPLGYAILYLSVIAGTLLLSQLSYKYFEAYFLKLKNRFTLIKTAQNK